MQLTEPTASAKIGDFSNLAPESMLDRTPLLVDTEAKLQVRKLAFDQQTNNVKGPGIAADGCSISSPTTASSMTRESVATQIPNQQGLPSLLKKLRQDAQEEIFRATAHIRQIVRILGLEIQQVEGDRDAACACYEANMVAMLSDLRVLEKQREELLREKRELHTQTIALESRNAVLTLEMAEVRAEAQQAHERADAMEAATALLQNAKDDVDFVRTDSFTADEHEERVGSRSINGSVSLANVPAMHGGALSYEYVEDKLERGALGSIRIDHRGLASGMIEVVGRTRASGSKGSSLFGRQIKAQSGLDAYGGGCEASGGQLSSSQETGAVRGSVTRKLSFTRKAGRKIVRSLSFGAEVSKHDWDDRDQR